MGRQEVFKKHFLYKLYPAKSLQSCLTLCDPIDSSPPRLPHPWDSPGRYTAVGCHFLLQCMKVKSESEVAQVVSDPQRPHGLQPTRLLCPWDFPGKSTGVGCHCLLPNCTQPKLNEFLRDTWLNNNQMTTTLRLPCSDPND